jgi:hypothetical protein
MLKNWHLKRASCIDIHTGFSQFAFGLAKRKEKVRVTLEKERGK